MHIVTKERCKRPTRGLVSADNTVFYDWLHKARLVGSFSHKLPRNRARYCETANCNTHPLTYRDLALFRNRSRQYAVAIPESVAQPDQGKQTTAG